MKIDRTFVAGVASSAADRAIVSSIVSTGRAFGYNIIAEGVETEAQAAALAQLGCHLLQGELIAGAVPAESMIGLCAAIEQARTAAMPATA